MPVNSNTFSEADLLALIDNGATESKFLEFKFGAPSVGDLDEKAEFCRDVSSFANAEGGSIIYGVREDKSKNVFVPTPFSVSKPDQFVIQLQQILETGIRPRIFGIDIILIPAIDGNFYLLIRTNKSISAPHMVVKDKSFSYRTSKKKQQMEVEDIRTIILSNSTFFENAEKWIRDRVSPPTQTHYRKFGVLLFIHCIPLGFDFNLRLPATTLASQSNFIAPLGGLAASGGLRHVFNLHGFRTECRTNEIEECDSVQFFRSGQIEGRTYLKLEGDDSLNAAAVEAEIMRSVVSYLMAQKNLNISPPIIVGISLRDVNKVKLREKDVDYTSHGAKPFSQNTISLPPVVVEAWPTSDKDIAVLIKPIFDTLWNAAGKPRSPHFNQDGEFVFPLGCF